MQVTLGANRRALLDVSEPELVIINNSLNEVCNGVEIEDFEFETRLGATREAVRHLLGEISAALKQGRPRST